MEREQFQEWFDKGLQEYVNQKTKGYQEFTSKKVILEIIAQIQKIASKGKRVRPYLAYLSYFAKTGGGPEEIKNELFAIELFHTFCLVHDDVIDEDSTRRGEQTVNSVAEESYKNLGRKELATKTGAAQAILVGDLVFAWVFSLMAKRLGDEKIEREFLYTVDEVVVGQMIDVDLTARKETTREEILEKMKLKTAGYTFIQPLRIGRLLAGASAEDELIDKMGLSLGMGFQMQDDMLDVFSAKEKLGKNIGSDIEEGQHTLLTQHVTDHGTEHDIRELHVLIGRAVNEDRLQLLKELFERTGAVKTLNEEITNNLEEAKKCAQDCDWPEESKRLLIKFVDYVADRSY